MKTCLTSGPTAKVKVISSVDLSIGEIVLVMSALFALTCQATMVARPLKFDTIDRFP